MHKYLTLFFIFLIAMTVICGLAYWKGMDNFLFAWVLNFILMMCLLSYTQTVKPKFSSSYYNSKKWEKEGKIYKLFGVSLFRKLLVSIGWEKLNKKANPVNKNSDTLLHLEYATRQSEFGHLVIFFIVLVCTIFVAITFGMVASLWLILLNILLNIYPVILQRYNRPRFKKAIKISQRHNH